MRTKPKRTLMEAFLTFFGDLKVFRWPMFLLYQPGGYQLKGEDVREVLEKIRPGDILVRGYLDYLDGYFIPGYFSHVGLYLGDVTEQDRGSVMASKQAHHECDPVFRTGQQMVIHALAEGVLLEDILQFCRCDYMAILRLPDAIKAPPGAAPQLIEEALFSEDEKKLHHRLQGGETLSISEVVACVRAAALGKLGTAYDFKFDFARFEKLSCSELVYFATKCVSPFLGIAAQDRKVLFVKRSMIIPDAFVDSPLDVVWKSKSIRNEKFAVLRQNWPSESPAVGMDEKTVDVV